MKNEDIKVSVIIPVYNENSKYLDNCVYSICNQSYRNLEIILVDDGSSAPCREHCDAYGKMDQRIKVIHKENGGSQSARRTGIEEATGEYVAFVDSDDWVELELYQKMAEIIAKNQPDMLVASNYYRNYADGTVLKATDNKREGFWENCDFEAEVFPYFIKTEKYFDTEFPVAMWTYLFKKDFAYVIVKKISDSLKTAEDYVFLMTAFLNAKSFSAISYRGYHYRSNTASKLHTIKNVKKLLYLVYEAVEHEISESNYDQEELKQKNRIIIFHSLMLRDYKVLFETEHDFLFPFPRVTKGSKIFIYGAGKMGKQIYHVIKNSSDYEISGIADRNWESYRKQGMEVIAPEDILDKEFDYVIIAITYVSVREQIKKMLMEMGVPEDKFAEVDTNVFDEKHLVI